MNHGSKRNSKKWNKNTFKKILGYELTTPGFADDILNQLEVLGCSHAREYYETVKNEWQQEYSSQMKNTGEWYRIQDFERKEVNESRKQEKQQEVERKNRGLSREYVVSQILRW